MIAFQPLHGSWPVATLTLPGFEVLSGVHEPSSVLARHTHETPTICCVGHGRFTEYYPGKAVDCAARTLKVTPAGEPHWNQFAAVRTYGIRIDVDPTRFEGVPEVQRMLDERLFFVPGAFDALVYQLVAELRRGDQISQVAAEGLLLELVARLAGGWQARQADTPTWLSAADEVVRTTFRSPPGVAAIAAMIGVPATTLARAYRQKYGCTIAQRVRSLRLQQAAQELATSRRPIAQIAAEAGYYDQSHFSNVFRRFYGTTPAAWRRESGGVVSPRALRRA